jgi:hypothetical protein
MQEEKSMKGIGNSREQFVAKLKERLDAWNARAAKWEELSATARSEQLAEYRSRRDAALYNLKLLEGATGAAWAEVAAGADDAWQRMEKAFDLARVHFEKSPRK